MGEAKRRDKIKAGRLALREEGDNWNAYYALAETMEGAIFLGSIRMAIVISSADRKREFMQLMRDVVSDILREIGHRPIWGDPETGPEHERAGNA